MGDERLTWYQVQRLAQALNTFNHVCAWQGKILGFSFAGILDEGESEGQMLTYGDSYDDSMWAEVPFIGCF